MTIFKPKANPNDANDKVADFSYVPNDALAQLVIDAWVNPDIKAKLLDRQTAKEVFATRGFYWNEHANAAGRDHGSAVPCSLLAAGRKRNRFCAAATWHGTCPPGQNLLARPNCLDGPYTNGI